MVIKEAKLSKTPVIAIVDDDESFRHATMSFIRSLGYTVAEFASAEAFLKSDRVYETDCLISDVQMPGMVVLGPIPSAAPPSLAGCYRCFAAFG